MVELLGSLSSFVQLWEGRGWSFWDPFLHLYSYERGEGGGFGTPFLHLYSYERGEGRAFRTPFLHLYSYERGEGRAFGTPFLHLYSYLYNNLNLSIQLSSSFLKWMYQLYGDYHIRSHLASHQCRWTDLDMLYSVSGGFSDSKFSDGQFSDTIFPTANFPTTTFSDDYIFRRSNFPTDKFSDRQFIYTFNIDTCNVLYIPCKHFNL